MKVEWFKCRCGGKHRYVDIGPLLDQFECDKCGWKTKGYYDGAEYAYSEWQKRNDPDPKPDPRMERMRRLLEQYDKEREWKKYSDRN